MLTGSRLKRFTRYGPTRQIRTKQTPQDRRLEDDGPNQWRPEAHRRGALPVESAEPEANNGLGVDGWRDHEVLQER